MQRCRAAAFCELMAVMIVLPIDNIVRKGEGERGGCGGDAS